MKPEHTEGPWTIHQNGDGSYSILGEKISNKEYKWIIGFIQNGEIITEEQLANAKLIAAVPELLQSLIELVGTEHEEDPNKVFDAFYNARKIIKKATE